MTRSLKARLILASSLVLIAFLSATGYALDRAFRQSGLALVEDRLQTQIYGLLALAELDSSDRLVLPADLPDERLSLPESGLYGEVRTADGGIVWRSGSLLGLDAQVPRGYTEIRARFRVKARPGDLDRIRELANFSPVLNTITRGARVAVDVDLK